MTLRRKSRIFALQMLFEWDMTRQEPARVEKLFWRSAPATASTRDFANQLFEGAVKQVDTLDELAAKFAENWRLERIAAIDRNILRLAIYEMRAATAPSNVVINEALELAKKFSSARAPSFLNGVLDAVRRSFAT
jgi:N utilization substance protein B